MTSSWLSEFKSLAARRTKLVRVVAVDYGDPSEPLLEPLWLRFAGSPWLRLSSGATGQGLSLDEEPPREEEFEANSVSVVRDLGGEPRLPLRPRTRGGARATSPATCRPDGGSSRLRST